MTLNSSQPSNVRSYVNNLIQLGASWDAYLCYTFVKELAAVEQILAHTVVVDLSLFVPMIVNLTLRNLMKFIKNLMFIGPCIIVIIEE